MSQPVTVIGLGLMGRALADTLAAAGVATTAWNRTPRPEVVRPGVMVANSLGAAMAASPTVIVCVADTPAAMAVLTGEHGTPDLCGRDIINLTTGRPGDAGELGGIANAAGAHYLDGIIAAFPESIGDPGTQIVVAGDEQAWTRTHEVLEILGGDSFWTGSTLGEPAVLDIAVALNYYHVALAGFVTSARYAFANKVSSENLLRVVGPAAAKMERHAHQMLAQIVSHDFSTDQATVDVHLAAVELARDEMGDHGAMLTPLIEYLRQARAAGAGAEAFAAIGQRATSSNVRGIGEHPEG